MSANGLILFFVFAVILVGVYIGIRRRLAPFGVLAGIGIFGGIITMTMFASSQEGVLLPHALLVGFFIGGGIGLSIVLLAWYFLKQEANDRKAKGLP